ncbi:hypothetical protein BGX38DRAFT_1218951 [Terfezia claveryi]|nr:hypothetical protein BGX38DRAFT_1218951 [Terfezia claveryi]
MSTEMNNKSHFSILLWENPAYVNIKHVDCLWRSLASSAVQFGNQQLWVWRVIPKTSLYN